MLKWLANNAVGTWLFTRRRGEPVGQDDQGNLYYRERRAPGVGPGDFRAERRWVVYAGSGEIEPSSVPPGWFGWLHHTREFTPVERPLPTPRPWQKPHEPNHTGTPLAYVPPGHELRGGRRAKATGDYEAWRP